MIGHLILYEQCGNTSVSMCIDIDVIVECFAAADAIHSMNGLIVSATMFYLAHAIFTLTIIVFNFAFYLSIDWSRHGPDSGRTPVIEK